jgi:hypothetical protein
MVMSDILTRLPGMDPTRLFCNWSGDVITIIDHNIVSDFGNTTPDEYVLVTTDGGRNFNTIIKGGPDLSAQWGVSVSTGLCLDNLRAYLSMHHDIKENGFYLHDRGQIWQTTDGGANWTTIIDEQNFFEQYLWVMADWNGNAWIGRRDYFNNYVDRFFGAWFLGQ